MSGFGVPSRLQHLHLDEGGAEFVQEHLDLLDLLDLVRVPEELAREYPPPGTHLVVFVRQDADQIHGALGVVFEGSAALELRRLFIVVGGCSAEVIGRQQLMPSLPARSKTVVRAKPSNDRPGFNGFST